MRGSIRRILRPGPGAAREPMDIRAALKEGMARLASG